MDNSNKYGSKGFDIIEKMFNSSYEEGVGFCKGNILKYIERYNRVNKMTLYKKIYYWMCGKGTKSDLKKAKDYQDRWSEKAIKNKTAWMQFKKFRAEMALYKY